MRLASALLLGVSDWLWDMLLDTVDDFDKVADFECEPDLVLVEDELSESVDEGSTVKDNDRVSSALEETVADEGNELE